jgi:hypothetical protein
MWHLETPTTLTDPPRQECKGHLSLIFLLRACLVLHGLLHTSIVSLVQIDGQSELTHQELRHLPLR